MGVTSWRQVALAPLVASACSFAPKAAVIVGDDAVDAAGDGAPDASSPFAPCARKPADPNATVVSDVATLRTALAAAAPNTTVALADGTYDLSPSGGGGIAITTTGVTVRSLSNDPSKVILDGGFQSTPLVAIGASNVALISVTLAHGLSGAAVSITPPATTMTGDVIFDVTFADDDGTDIRVFPTNADASTGAFVDDGELGCSRFDDTATDADHCSAQTLGFYAQAIRGWTIHDNTFENVACNTSVHRTVFVFGGSRDVQILRNVIVNSPMNITAGYDTSIVPRTYADAVPAACSGATPQFWGGLICDNSIAGLGVPPLSGSPQPFDDGMELWTTCDTWIMHNTIVSPGSGMSYDDIEYRFAGTYVHLVNNLLEQAPFQREGSPVADPAYLASNALYGATTDFVNAATGDLHLAAAAPELPGVSIAGLPGCTSDADGKPRSMAAPMVGAFER